MVHFSEVPKFLAESSSMNTLAAAHLLIILLHVSWVSSYFDVYFQSISEYENEEISKIHITAEEPP